MNRFADPTRRAEWELDGSGPMTLKKSLEAELSYDPESGVFTWRKCGRGQAKRAGAIAGSPHSNGYVRIKVAGRTFYAHRLAWLFETGDWPKEQIDHKNRDQSDNRFVNLREATVKENRRNTAGIPSRRKHSRFKGVTRDKRGGRWRAQIHANGKTTVLGYFDSEESAAMAYANAAIVTHGEFAQW